MSVKYIARLKCDSDGCDSTAEVDVHIDHQLVGSYDSQCEHELSYDPPRGWLGGYAAGVPLVCPRCVEEKYR